MLGNSSLLYLLHVRVKIQNCCVKIQNCGGSIDSDGSTPGSHVIAATQYQVHGWPG
jgi:hypothetical protein